MFPNKKQTAIQQWQQEMDEKIRENNRNLGKGKAADWNHYQNIVGINHGIEQATKRLQYLLDQEAEEGPVTPSAIT